MWLVLAPAPSATMAGTSAGRSGLAPEADWIPPSAFRPNAALGSKSGPIRRQAFFTSATKSSFEPFCRAMWAPSSA